MNLKSYFCSIKIISFSFKFRKCTFAIDFVHKILIPRGIRFSCTKYMANVCFLNSKLNCFKIIAIMQRKN